MHKAEPLSRANYLLTEMYRADVPKVATLAHSLSNLARQESLHDVEEAAREVEDEIVRGRAISLSQLLTRLSEAIQRVESHQTAL